MTWSTLIYPMRYPVKNLKWKVKSTLIRSRPENRPLQLKTSECRKKELRFCNVTRCSMIMTLYDVLWATHYLQMSAERGSSRAGFKPASSAPGCGSCARLRNGSLPPGSQHYLAVLFVPNWVHCLFIEKSSMSHSHRNPDDHCWCLATVSSTLTTVGKLKFFINIVLSINSKRSGQTQIWLLKKSGRPTQNRK